MTGINKRSTDPKVDQKKMKKPDFNPFYGGSGFLKPAIDKVNNALGGKKKKK